MSLTTQKHTAVAYMSEGIHKHTWFDKREHLPTHGSRHTCQFASLFRVTCCLYTRYAYAVNPERSIIYVQQLPVSGAGASVGMLVDF